MFPEPDQATPDDAERDGADVRVFGHRMLLDLAVSYALVLGPRLHVDPGGLLLACPRCGTWAGRPVVAPVVGLGCARCLAAGGTVAA